MPWERVQAILVGADAMILTERRRIAELALATRLASMFVQRENVEVGGLMSYGESIKEFNRRAAVFVKAQSRANCRSSNRRDSTW
jgi:putative ABC transport system substrate-binding protein